MCLNDSAASSLAFAELEVGIRLNSKALNAFKVLNALLAWLRLSSRLLLERKVSLPFRIETVGVNYTTSRLLRLKNLTLDFGPSERASRLPYSPTLCPKVDLRHPLLMIRS